MADKNHTPRKNRKSSGGMKPQKRKNDSGDKFDWRKATRTLSFWILLIIGSWIIFDKINLNDQPESQRSYTEYRRELEYDQVLQVKIIDRELHADLKDGSTIVTILPFVDSAMMAEWDSLKIDYEFREKTTSWVSMLITSILPWIIIIAIWIYIMRRMQGGGTKGLFSFGKSRAKLLVENKPKVTFKDVAGVDEAKEELQEIISFLRDPKKFTRLGGRLPKGGLLLGPPGTGKTLLARAVAGEADVPFFSMSGADFVEMFVGVGAARVRDLFEQGKKSAPCIIFIDEIDAVGRHRGAGLGGGHDEREQTLNQLLVEMDGFESSEGVILIAATNRPDVLDPALTRPGRFDRQIVVDRPDVRGREGILKVHVRNIPLDKDVKLEILAKSTPGLAGADIANMVNEAALLAARRNANKVSMSDFEDAKDKIMMGTERKSILISEEEKRQTAYHEAGHVLVSKLTPGADPVHKVTIIPRGRALGLTHFLPLDEKHNYSRSYLLQSLNHLLGGRAAEKLVFNELSTGAGNDIERATHIARKMICKWGMSDKLGPVTYGRKQDEIFIGRDFVQQRDYSEKIAQEIDQEVRRIVKEAEKRAETILRGNMEKLKRLAEALLEREILDGHEIDLILKGEKLPKQRPASREKEPFRKAVRGRRPVHKEREQKERVEPRAVTPAAARRKLAREYGIVSSRDPQNRRPSPSQLAKSTSSSKDESRDDSTRPVKEKQKPAKTRTGRSGVRKPAVKPDDTRTTGTRKPSTRRTTPRGKNETETPRGEKIESSLSELRRSSSSKRLSATTNRDVRKKKEIVAGKTTRLPDLEKKDTLKKPPPDSKRSRGLSLFDDPDAGTADKRVPSVRSDYPESLALKPPGEIDDKEKPAPEVDKSKSEVSSPSRYEGAGFESFWNRQSKSKSPEDDVPAGEVSTRKDTGRMTGIERLQESSDDEKTDRKEPEQSRTEDDAD